MDKYLYKIGNTILLHLQYKQPNGLLNGKLGICIFFYHLSHYLKNEQYQHLADNLLEDVIGSIHDKNLGFADGLCGIAFGINYLINNNFVNGDPEIILEDIEKTIYDNIEKQMKNDFLSDYPLFSIGLYITSKKICEIDKKHITRLVDACKIAIKEEDNFEYISTSMSNSILYVLSYLQNSGICEYSHMALDLLALLLKRIPNLEDNKDRRSFHRLLKSIPIKTNHEELFFQQGTNCPQKIFLWEELLYFKDEFWKMDEEEVDNSIENIIWGDLVNNLSFNGLASIGLNIIKQEQAKNRYQ